MGHAIQRVRDRVALSGLTREAVARAAGIHPSQFSRYLNGIIEPPPEFEKKVNAALDRLEKAEKAAQKARDRVLNEEPKSA